MAKKPALFLILILLIIGAGAAYWWNTSHAQEAKNAANNKQAAPPQQAWQSKLWKLRKSTSPIVYRVELPLSGNRKCALKWMEL